MMKVVSNFSMKEAHLLARRPTILPLIKMHSSRAPHGVPSSAANGQLGCGRAR